jgi:SpoVK/Ycf46/Vps4 family AAA+-type ATPase
LQAIERDRGGKAKKKKKKAKKKKGKKKKKDKDLTAGRPIESIFEELVHEGVIIKCPKVRLSEYVGEYSYLATTLRQKGIEPMPSLSDVKRVITELCILPLGSQAVHEQAPLVKSVMLAGPRGVGKKMLVHSICTETGANLFDITPANVAGKFAGKKGLDMLLHMVFKVAKLWSPSVVYVGDCERTFVKKIPKTDKTDPKRFKKPFPKILKTMKPEDRVLIVGVTKQPYDAEVKGLCNMYQRIIMVPRPDYASRYVTWRSLILRNGGKLTEDLDLGALAKVSDGYTPGHFNTAVQQLLTDRRIHQVRLQPTLLQRTHAHTNTTHL